MEYVIGVLALLIVLSVILGVLAVAKTVRAVKRGVERTGTQARRVVEATALKARTAQTGPVGELARIRLGLRSSIDSTRHALEAGVRSDSSLSEALSLLDRLQAHARQLDGELGVLMDREPDRSRIATRLPEIRRQAEHIRHSADSLRWAARDRARQYDADGLTSLQRQIEIEAGALRPWPDMAAVLPPDGHTEVEARGRQASSQAEGDRGRPLDGSARPDLGAGRKPDLGTGPKQRPQSAS